MKNITVKDNRMFANIVLFDMHTEYYLKAIDGISDKDAHNRLNTKANHVAWLAGSLVHERYEMAKNFGKTLTSSSTQELFKDWKGIQDNVTYPSLQQYKKDWETISPVLKDLLINADSTQLNKTEDMGGQQFSYFDFCTFLSYREANCIGQIILWRRLLGYEPMKYM